MDLQPDGRRRKLQPGGLRLHRHRHGHGQRRPGRRSLEADHYRHRLDRLPRQRVGLRPDARKLQPEPALQRRLVQPARQRHAKPVGQLRGDLQLQQRLRFERGGIVGLLWRLVHRRGRGDIQRLCCRGGGGGLDQRGQLERERRRRRHQLLRHPQLFRHQRRRLDDDRGQRHRLRQRQHLPVSKRLRPLRGQRGRQRHPHRHVGPIEHGRDLLQLQPAGQLVLCLRLGGGHRQSNRHR